jgi:hypothetical protein
MKMTMITMKDTLSLQFDDVSESVFHFRPGNRIQNFLSTTKGYQQLVADKLKVE